MGSFWLLSALKSIKSNKSHHSSHFALISFARTNAIQIAEVSVNGMLHSQFLQRQACPYRLKTPASTWSVHAKALGEPPLA